MESGQVQQLLKRQYRNNTGGWLGVVTLDHKGEEQGVNVEPFGTVWLSDAEAILTARASRRAEDNPFEEQTFVMQDPETSKRKEVAVRPLTLEGDGERYVPANDRYVPDVVNEAEGRVLAAAAALADTPANVSVGHAVAERSAEIEAEAAGSVRPMTVSTQEAPPEAGPLSTGSPAPSEGAPPAPPVAPQAAPVPPVRSEPPATPATAPAQGLAGSAGPPSDSSVEADAEAQSWAAEPEAPGQVLAGALGGSDDVPQVAGDPTLPQPGDGVQAPAQAAPQQPGAVPAAEEEHAARVDPSVGEETGQARPPTGEPPEGEYARAEEVGSPDAPTSEDDGESLVGA